VSLLVEDVWFFKLIRPNLKRRIGGGHSIAALQGDWGRQLLTCRPKRIESAACAGAKSVFISSLDMGGLCWVSSQQLFNCCMTTVVPSVTVVPGGINIWLAACGRWYMAAIFFAASAKSSAASSGWTVHGVASVAAPMEQTKTGEDALGCLRASLCCCARCV
jgi:hypothetical protein